MKTFIEYIKSIFYVLYYVDIDIKFREQVKEHGINPSSVSEFDEIELIDFDDKHRGCKQEETHDRYLVRLPLWKDLISVEECIYIPSVYETRMHIKPEYITLLDKD